MTDQLGQIYQNRKTEFATNLAKEQRQSDLLVLFRSLVSLSVIGLAAYGLGFGTPSVLLYTPPLVLLFFILVVKHQQVKQKLNYLQNIIRINEHALLRLSGKWADSTPPASYPGPCPPPGLETAFSSHRLG